jgi:hypothetical protein
MTLLNTFTNLGGTWPKYFVLKGKTFSTSSAWILIPPNAGVDILTVATCKAKEGSSLVVKGKRRAFKVIPSFLR